MYVSFRNVPREILSKQLYWTKLINRPVNYDVLYQVYVEIPVLNKNTNTTNTLKNKLIPVKNAKDCSLFIGVEQGKNGIHRKDIFFVLPQY